MRSLDANLRLTYRRLPLPALLGLLSCAATEQTPARRELLEVLQVQQTEIVYRRVTLGERQVVDLSDLDVWPAIVTGRDPFGVYLNSSVDLKELLLERGWATLKNPGAAPEAHRRAQQGGREAKRGVWASGGGPEWTALAGRAWKVLFWLFSAGILAMLARLIYARWYIQRRVSLALVGEPSAGKSAILERLVNPKVTRQQILELSMTKGLQKRKHPNFIPKGRFEIHPTLSDVPGTAYGVAWDILLTRRSRRRPSALLLVLAPCTAATPSKDGWDPKYIYTQLGYVQAYIAGGLGSTRTRKPRVVILFINKFDLLSDAPPEDSASKKAVEDIRGLFAEHVQVAQVAAGNTSVAFHCLIGSALENWNCERIIDLVTRELYGF